MYGAIDAARLAWILSNRSIQEEEESMGCSIIDESTHKLMNPSNTKVHSADGVYCRNVYYTLVMRLQDPNGEGHGLIRALSLIVRSYLADLAHVCKTHRASYKHMFRQYLLDEEGRIYWRLVVHHGFLGMHDVTNL